MLVSGHGLEATILNKHLATPCNICQGINQFVPFPQLNVVYHDEVVIARLQRCTGRGLPILVMPLGIVPKIPCQHIFMLSDPSVPRTFVVDCQGFSDKLIVAILHRLTRYMRRLQEKEYLCLHCNGPCTMLTLP